MREHKYRIWDAKNKEFVYFNLRRLVGHWSETVFDPNEPSTQSNDREGVAGVNGKDSLLASAPLDEFTGLKDKNGKEIYEGDVVRIQHPHDKIVTDRGIELHGEFWDTLGRVFWWNEEGGWYHGHESVKGGNGRPPKRMWEYSEVVGNTYENPELLEVKR